MTLQKIEQNVPLAAQQHIERAVNYVFAEMFAASTVAKAQYKTDAEIEQAKTVWLKGFIEAGVSSREELERGLKHFRHHGKFMPVLSEFLSWCKGNSYERYGLPEPADVLDRLEAFKSRDYKPMQYRSNAEYWLLSAIERKQKANIWLKAEELQKLAEEELKTTLEKLKSGVKYGTPEQKELSKHTSIRRMSDQQRKQCWQQIWTAAGVRK